MTTRFKTALAALIGLAATTAVVIILLGVFDDPASNDPTYVGEEDGAEHKDPETAMSGGTVPEGTTPGLAGAGTGPDAPGVGSIRPGMRTPSGLDLSDQVERDKYLASLIDVRPVDWDELARVLRVATDRLPDEIRDFLLEAIRGPGKNYAMKAFRVLADGSMAVDLLAILDDPNKDARTNAAVLQALYSMPGANADEVALGLEARLTDEFARDRLLIQAIAARGGTEATRALIDYIRRMDKPGLINAYHLRGIDLRENKDAQDVVISALRDSSEMDPDALRQVLTMTAQPGNSTFSKAVIALDQDGQTDAVRKEVLKTLSRIGGEAALGHLLKRAAQPGVYGEFATEALGKLLQKDAASVKLLTGELERAGNNPRPEAYRSALLLALGNLRADGAAEKVVTYLDDRSRQVARTAIRAIGRLESKGQKYVPQLAQRWAGADVATKVSLAIALGSIGGKDAVTALEAVAGEKDMSQSLLRTVRSAIVHAKKLIQGRNNPPPVGAPVLGGTAPVGPQGGGR